MGTFATKENQKRDDQLDQLTTATTKDILNKVITDAKATVASPEKQNIQQESEDFQAESSSFLDIGKLGKKDKEDYEKFLSEAATKLLTIGFGLPGGKDIEKTEDDKFNSDNWIFAINGSTKASSLVLKEGKNPSDAIDEIFNNPAKWAIDCSRFVQLLHMYALLHTVGAKKFDKEYKGQAFIFTTHDSTSVVGGVNYTRPSKDSPYYKNNILGPKEPRDEAALLAAAPIGTRVGFKVDNLSGTDATSEYVFENTVKLGNDSYAAHGFEATTKKNVFTKAELELELAKMFYKRPEGMSDTDYTTALNNYVTDNIYISEIQPINRSLFKK